MQPMDVNSLFARAERAYQARQFDAARADLQTVQRLAGDHPTVLHLAALIEKGRGDAPAARTAFDEAMRLAPRDPQIANNAANLLIAMGEIDAALAAYGRALAFKPDFHEARLNRAIALHEIGRMAEARFDFETLAAGSPTARMWSARGAMERSAGDLTAAAQAYEHALQLDPAWPSALRGRARVAMERGEDDASRRFAIAIKRLPDEPALILGQAEALEAEGDPAGLEKLAAVVAAKPRWAEGQAVLARMRWEAGEGKDFTRGLDAALLEAPDDRNLWFALASSLAAADLTGEAADAAAQGRARAGDEPTLRLLEAVQASEAGQARRADALFAGLPGGLVGREAHEVRHRIRQGDYDRATALLEQARAQDGNDVGSWALTGLLWRAIEDPRAAWLHEQPGLVRVLQLELTGREIEDIAGRLRSLHRARAHPIGQSLRGGTQTRGRLFERPEPEVGKLRDAIGSAVIDYWNALPPADPAHPLLRHRDAGPRFGGSWSVRLSDGGFHVSHVHPHGIVSSACYLIAPPTGGQEGWLEIGRPPPELGLVLPPLAAVEPIPGRLALFPSTLFHGTRPFPAGERLTAAFDVLAR